MKKRAILAEIIILTVLFGVIFTGVIFAYSKIFIEPNIYTIQFKDIDGITKGSPVRFMGMYAGYVRKLTSKNKYINVEIVLTQKDMKIPNGTVARVEFYGLGGSKSIELMPPDGSCDVGILSEGTIRINDVAREVIGIVEIIESMEKYVKSFNQGAFDKIIDSIEDVKNYSFNKTEDMMKNFSQKQEQQVGKIRIKQKELQNKIEKVDENVNKINQFIKR